MSKIANKKLIKHFNGVFYLPPGDHGLSICRVYSGNIDRAKTSDSKFYRKQLVTITNLGDDRKIVRQIVGPTRIQPTAANPNPKGITADQIGLDYDARDELGLVSKEANISVKVAGHFDQFGYYWNHEDRATRFATQLGVLGAALGVIGVALGGLSLVLAF